MAHSTQQSQFSQSIENHRLKIHRILRDNIEGYSALYDPFLAEKDDSEFHNETEKNQYEEKLDRNLDYEIALHVNETLYELLKNRLPLSPQELIQVQQNISDIQDGAIQEQLYSVVSEFKALSRPIADYSLDEMKQFTAEQAKQFESSSPIASLVFDQLSHILNEKIIDSSVMQESLEQHIKSISDLETRKTLTETFSRCYFLKNEMNQSISSLNLSQLKEFCQTQIQHYRGNSSSKQDHSFNQSPDYSQAAKICEKIALMIATSNLDSKDDRKEIMEIFAKIHDSRIQDQLQKIYSQFMILRSEKTTPQSPIEKRPRYGRGRLIQGIYEKMRRSPSPTSVSDQSVVHRSKSQ